MRRASALLVALAMTVGLVACSPSEPSQEQLACEADGGEWVMYRSGTTVIFSGKTPIMVPQYAWRCEGAS